jgi:hypothetical protein
VKTLLNRLFAAKKPAIRRPAPTSCPTLEVLEDRRLLSWGSVPPSLVNLHAATDYHYNINYFNTTGGYNQTDIIVRSNEVDYRTFTAQRTGQYTFDAKAIAGSRIDTVAALYDTNGHRLTYNDDYGGSLNSHFTYNLTSGRNYVFGITNYTGSPIGAYQAIITPPSISNLGSASGSGWIAVGDARLTGANLHLDLSASNSTLFSTRTDRVYVQVLDLSGRQLFQSIWSESVTTYGQFVPGPSSVSRGWDINLSAFDLGHASSLRVWAD